MNRCACTSGKGRTDRTKPWSDDRRTGPDDEGLRRTRHGRESNRLGRDRSSKARLGKATKCLRGEERKRRGQRRGEGEERRRMKAWEQAPTIVEPERAWRRASDENASRRRGEDASRRRARHEDASRMRTRDEDASRMRARNDYAPRRRPPQKHPTHQTTKASQIGEARTMLVPVMIPMTQGTMPKRHRWVLPLRQSKGHPQKLHAPTIVVPKAARRGILSRGRLLLGGDRTARATGRALCARCRRTASRSCSATCGARPVTADIHPSSRRTRGFLTGTRRGPAGGKGGIK